MEPWIQGRWEYVKPDVLLTEMFEKWQALGIEHVHELLGVKDRYTLEDARRIQKNQYKPREYRERMDLPDSYSPQRMLEIVRERARYLLERGSTLNNPHIPAGYFKGWERITRDHAATLRRMVSNALGMTAEGPGD